MNVILIAVISLGAIALVSAAPKENSIIKRVAKYVWNTPNPSTT